MTANRTRHFAKTQYIPNFSILFWTFLQSKKNVKTTFSLSFQAFPLTFLFQLLGDVFNIRPLFIVHNKIKNILFLS